MQITSFVFVSLLGSHTGGQPALAESIYIRHDGFVQISEALNDGTLRRLREGRVDPGPYFSHPLLVNSTQASPLDNSSVEFGELTDAFPPRVVLAYLTTTDEYLIKSYERSNMPGVVAAMAKQVIALRDRPEIADAPPGLYVRGQRLPHFDSRIQSSDVSVDHEQVSRNPIFSKVINDEMRLIRAGPAFPGTTVLAGAVLSPERPIHIEIEKRFYRILAYVTEQRNQKGER